MARSKVKLAWIANDASRRSALRKRCKGLIKKVSEISTLCGVDASLVLYTAPDREPEVWPSLDEAKRLFEDFRQTPEVEHSRKNMNQETFLNLKIAKLQEQLRKEESEVREMEATGAIFDAFFGDEFGELAIEKAAILVWTIERKLNQIHSRMEDLGEGGVGGATNGYMTSTDTNMNNLLGDDAVAPTVFPANLVDMNMVMPVPVPVPMPMHIPMPVPVPVYPCDDQEMTLQRQSWMMYNVGGVGEYEGGDQQSGDPSSFWPGSAAWNYFP